MKYLLDLLVGPATPAMVQLALAFMRVSLGVLMVVHGIPKLGGMAAWHNLAKTFMFPLGISFWPLFWGFFAAYTEFFGGIMFMLGFGTRVASLFFIIAMIVAAAWHIKKGDPFMVYSHALALIVVFVGFLIIGSGSYSIDEYVHGLLSK